MRRKFGNKFSGGYHSKKEHRRADELRLMAKVGAISRLEEQVEFELIPKQDGELATKYIADFAYHECDGTYVVEDVKSEMTRKLPEYVIKRKLMLYVHKIRIRQT
jgi:hypothetical protein